jgi:hypothetical protein
MGYEDYSPLPDKLLHGDGSVTTFSGAQVKEAGEAGVQLYESMSPIADKFLQPDGTLASLTEISGGSGGLSGISSETEVTGIEDGKILGVEDGKVVGIDRIDGGAF